MSNDETNTPAIPVGRVRALLTQYQDDLERLGSHTPEGRVYQRVCADLRRAIEPEHEPS